MKTAAIALATAGALAFPTAASAATQFEGTVVSVNRSAKTFRLHDAERGTKRIRVVASTRFHRVAGFRALRAGRTGIEVTAKRSGGRWVATLVERSGGGGGHGGSDD